MGKNVVRSSDLYGTLQFYLRLVGPKMLRDLTKMWMPVGKNVVIIGGAIQGCQLGEFMTKRGRKVTIVDTEEELGRMMYPERKTRLFYWFDKKGVELLGGVKLLEITDKGLSLRDQGRREALPGGRQRGHRPAVQGRPLSGGSTPGQGPRGVLHRRLRRAGAHPRRDRGRLEDRQRHLGRSDMDELIKLVAGKVGISAEQAEQAVHTVLGFLKDKLPEPIAGQLENIVGGGAGGAGGLPATWAMPSAACSARSSAIGARLFGKK